MITNYFKTAFRNLLRDKTFSVINIAGLAIGLAAFWAITLYIASEVSYENFHTKAPRIYRVAQHATWDGGAFHLPLTPPPYGPALKTEFPEVEEIVRLDAEGGAIITYNDKRLPTGDILLADSNFFNVFTYQFLYGDAKSALTKPQTIVLTKSLAEKIFGDAAIALNKTIELDKTNTMVTGVVEDAPTNSHFGFSALRPIIGTTDDSWSNTYLYTYILLKENANIRALEAKLPLFFNKYIKPSMGDVNYRAELQPLSSIHLHSHLDYELGPNGDIKYIYIFSLVAFLILVIASINYMNLATARSSTRIKEIGIRKVNGSNRLQLVYMFLTESVFLTLISSLIAVGILQLCMPWFQQFVGKPIHIWQFGVGKSLLLLAGFTLLAGCFSGIYPALFLSAFKLIPSLKGQAGSHKGNRTFRQSLVVFQFVITIAMIACSAIIFQQLKYTSNKNLGLNKDQVISFHISRQLRGKIPAFKAALLQNHLIEHAASAGNPIGNNNIGGRDFKAWDNGKLDTKSRMANILVVDEDFVPALEISMSQGRNFSAQMFTDKSNAVLVNETLAREAGWQNPEGKKIALGNDSNGNPILYDVAGITKDFNVYSLQHKIQPLIMRLPFETNEQDNIYVRLAKSDIEKALKITESVYREFDAANSFDYSFLDQNFAKQYEAEKKQGKMLSAFTALAISLACLGLFGLVTFSAEKRRKEIGIRKVLGGSVNGIVLLLSKDLLKLVGLAILIASPIAWWAMENWLQNFAYRIEIQWWVFVLSGVAGLLIAFAIISSKAIMAALANPIKSLRMD